MAFKLIITKVTNNVTVHDKPLMND